MARKTAHTIHQMFFDYFFDDDSGINQRVERLGSPLIPFCDPNTSPIIAAMNHLKESFIDKPPKSYCTLYSLNCITSHEDTSHHFLTHILGAWSSYARTKEIISDVWCLLMEEYGLSAEKIYFSYYGGDAEGKDCLLEYASEDRLFQDTSKGSFWNSCDIGPCGPCSGIYYNCDRNTDPLNCPEIGKILFVKFDRGTDGVLKPLQFQHVLVGLNFECLVSILQNKKSYYDTDICTPILTEIHAHAGNGIPTYHSAVGSNDVGEVAIAYQVFCDYLRVISVTAANHKQIGIHGREYLLKFMDRRVIQLGHQKLKIDGSSYFKLVSAAIKAMTVIIPELLPITTVLPQIAKSELDIYESTLAEIEHQQQLLQLQGKKKKKGTKLEPNPSIMWYKTRVVQFFGCERHIIYKDKNRKCPLIALCNALLLAGKIALESNIIEVSESYLLHLIQRHLMCGPINLKLQNKLEYFDFQKQILDVLPCLCGNLYMDVMFNSVNGFMSSPQLLLFEYLEVPLVHGWLLDPQVDTILASAISSRSFLQLSADVAIEQSNVLSDGHEVIARFLRGPQLTLYGLKSLREELKEKEPCVLLWNSSFITLTKVEGQIHFLVNDTSILSQDTTVVWELLKNENEGGSFMDCNFSPIDKTLNITTLPFSKSDKKKKKRQLNKEKKKHSELPSTSGKQDLLSHDPSILQPIMDVATTSNLGVESWNVHHQPNILPCNTSDKYYKTRRIDFFGQETYIILQDQNGPCPLLAICNVLLLKGKLSLPSDVSEIQESCLIRLLQKSIEESQKIQEVSQIQMLEFLPLLVDSIAVNVFFNSTDAFEESPLTLLFDFLNIDRYHGWIVNPEDTNLAAVSSLSFDSLSKGLTEPNFPYADYAMEFLQGPQLTPYGLRCLRKDIEEITPCVLFRDRHFNTIVKVEDNIYALVTDIGYSHTSVFWNRIDGVKGDESGADSRFNVIVSDQGVTHCTYMKPCEEKQGELNSGVDSSFKPNILDKGPAPLSYTKPRDQGHEKTDIRTSVKLPAAASCPSVSEVFSGRGSNESETLEHAAIKKINRNWRDGQPCIEPLEDFVSVSGNELSKPTILFSQGTSLRVAETTKTGRVFASDVLCDMVNAHTASHSWNGNFKIYVIDGCRAMIWGELCELTPEGMLKDHTAIVDGLFSLLVIEGVGIPAYFSHLSDTLLGFVPNTMLHIDMMCFWEFIKHHMALKCSLTRANFFSSIHRIRRNAPRGVKSTLKSLLSGQHGEDDWRDLIAKNGHPLLKKVMRYQRDKDASEQQDPIENPEYGDFESDFDSLSCFPRQVMEHAGDEDEDGEIVDEPFNSLSELELLYSHYLQNYLPCVHRDLLCCDSSGQLVYWLEDIFLEYNRKEVFSEE